jgi:predicted metalloendopeptidase
VTDSKAKARRIMAFETAIARVSWPIEKRRDVDAMYNPRTMDQLVRYAPGFEWQAFFTESKLGHRKELIVGELTAVRDIAKLIQQTPLATLKDYLTFHHLNGHAAYLPKRFDDARFAFYGATLRGQPKQRERWKRAVDGVNGSLGEQVAQVYVAKYFPPAELEGENGAARSEPSRGARRAHRCARLDDAGDEEACAREARHVRYEDRVPGQVEGLLDA